MQITGIADEASPTLEGQLDAHAELGWKTVELRSIDGVNVGQLDDSAFDRVRATLERRGFGVTCFSSAIANWARKITADFAVDVADLRRSAPRMRQLGTRFIRIMSWPNDGMAEREWRREVFRRLRELVRIAEDGGVVLAHENCSGWGGESPQNLAALLGEIDSPALRIVFDTGNPVAHGGPRDISWAFYRAARPFIEYFHIKDCVPGDKGEMYTYPGEGHGMVREIVVDLLATGYTGAFSIEPHIATQIHTGKGPTAGMDARAIYLEYGRRAQALFAEITGGRKT
ncbi:MAG: sugar phosphate isomerase/epimerase [Spirochaetes bacterium]|nr:sugar phosphate isomerase/epimerase [Spirochaetota bacterium]